MSAQFDQLLVKLDQLVSMIQARETREVSGLAGRGGAANADSGGAPRRSALADSFRLGDRSNAQATITSAAQSLARAVSPQVGSVLSNPVTGAASLLGGLIAAGGQGAAQGIADAPRFSSYGNLQARAAAGAESGKLGLAAWGLSFVADDQGPIGAYARDIHIGKEKLEDAQFRKDFIEEQTKSRLLETFGPMYAQGAGRADARQIRAFRDAYAEQARRQLEAMQDVQQEITTETTDPSRMSLARRKM